MSIGYVDAAAIDSRLRVEPHEEWFRTGDLGSLDEDGNLTYVDRVKDSLRRRGENVSSVEVETTVMRHPAVLEAAAVAIPSDLGEDDILVVVTLRPDAGLDYAELLDFCSARMPYFCVPRYLEVLDDIPKNVIGRVRKDLLRERGLGADAWDREATRLHPESLGREKKHDDDLSAGVRAQRRGRARGHSQPDRAAQPAVLRGRSRRLDRDIPARGRDRSYARGRRSPTCVRPSTAETGSGWSPSTTRSRSTASTPPSTVSRCCSSETNFAPPATYDDRLIYERGGWYFTSRELEWDVVPSKDALPV